MSLFAQFSHNSHKPICASLPSSVIVNHAQVPCQLGTIEIERSA
jgi:hypothetical protein